MILARELPGPPNAETHVELIEHRGGLAPLPAHPADRPHPPAAAAHARARAADPRRPLLRHRVRTDPEDSALDDWTRPLQLLAATLEFPDPGTGAPRRFASRRTLQACTDPAGWAAGAPVEDAGQQVSVSSKE